MKRRAIITGMSIFLAFTLATMVSGERFASAGEKTTTIEKQNDKKKIVQSTTVGVTHPSGKQAAIALPSETGISIQTEIPDLTSLDVSQVVEADGNTLSPDHSGRAVAGSDNYSMNWFTINGGGGEAASTNYEMNASVGQAAIGEASSDNYQAGVGYWYGVGQSNCDCGVWGDVTGDGNINPVDVVFMVNYVYKNIDQLVPYADCPNLVGDCTCDGNVNPVDVVFYVNFVYKNINQFCTDPCN